MTLSYLILRSLAALYLMPVANKFFYLPLFLIITIPRHHASSTAFSRSSSDLPSFKCQIEPWAEEKLSASSNAKPS